MWIRVTREAAEGKVTPSKNLNNTRTSINMKRKRHQSPEEIRYAMKSDYNFIIHSVLSDLIGFDYKVKPKVYVIIV